MNKIFKAVAIVLAIMLLSSCGENENVDAQGTDISEVLTSNISQLPKSTTTVASTSEIITTEATTTDYADYAEYWAMYEGYQKECDEFSGITIGSSRQEVIDAYGDRISINESAYSLGYDYYHEIQHLYAMDGNISYYPSIIGSLGYGNYSPRLSTSQAGFYKNASSTGEYYINVLGEYVPLRRKPNGL